MDRDNTIAAAVVSVVVLIVFAATAVLVVALPPDLSGWKAASVNQMVGASIAAFSTVVGYWVGSSRGSQTKDRTIAGLTAQMGKPPQ